MLTVKNPNSPAQATIRDNALVLSLDKAETPMVARFDLDSLAQANFVIQQKGNVHQLNLHDFSGSVQNIAQFANKIDAHQALQHILQALVSHSTPRQTPESIARASRIFSWILKILGIIFIIALLYVAYIYWQMRQHVAIMPPQATAEDQGFPEGEPQDVDSLFAPVTPEQ